MAADQKEGSEALFEELEDQVARQGVAVVSHRDGTTLMFTTAVLEALLAKSLESGDGRAVVFIKHAVAS